MDKKSFTGIDLSVFTQTPTTGSINSLDGKLTGCGKEFTFVQTISEPRHSPNTKIYKGRFLSLVQNKKGELIPYTRNINLLEIADLQAFQDAFAQELTEVLNIANKIHTQNA